MQRRLSSHVGFRAARAVAAITGLAVGLVLVFGASPAMGVGPGAGPGAGPAAGLGFRADTGFRQPYAGTSRYVKWAPTQAESPAQVNSPLGQERADEIASALGLDKSRVFTETQYVQFITGGGIGGDPQWAELVDESVRIFTNTTGRPLFDDSVLASYGLFVDDDGMLMSLANDAAPTKQVNPVLVPVRGYLATWCRANGCQDTLRMLYGKSAYPGELFFGLLSQQTSAPLQLVPNHKRGQHTTVGMSMAPSIWIVNFMLLYCLNPAVAAQMPGWWTPIPDEVVRALKKTRSSATPGQVPYSDYAHLFSG